MENINSKERIQLSDHFTYSKLFRFVLPSIVMMVFTSIYGVVDGYFISNFVGKEPFAAVNLIMPFLMILGGFGFMIGTGGSALVSKSLGENKKEEANKIFTLMVLVTLILGIVLTVLGIIFIRDVAYLFKADEEMIDDCVLYGKVVLIFNSAFMLQNVFQSFFVTSEKPKLGLIVTVVAGCTNMVLDALFIAVFKWGVSGAAIATGISQVVGAVLPIIYFSFPNNSLLKFTKPQINIKAILKAFGNGSSELMSNISSSLVSIVYNIQLMKYIGSNGVAAYGTIMYVQFIFIAIFVGYAIGSAPVIGYNYGAENHKELKNMFKKSIIINTSLGVIMLVLSECLAPTLSKIFVGYDEELYTLTLHAFRLFAFAFLFAGFNIFISSFFTALNNGIVSAIVSFLRTLVFQLASVLLLPSIVGVDGIWWAISIAEVLAFIVSIVFVITKRKKYNYM